MTEEGWIFLSYFILNTCTHERACILSRTDIYIHVLWGSLFLADIQRVLTEWLILKHYKSSNRMSSQLTFDPKAERRTAIMIWYYIQSLIGKHYFQYFKCITAFHESLRKNWKLLMFSSRHSLHQCCIINLLMSLNILLNLDLHRDTGICSACRVC